MYRILLLHNGDNSKESTELVRLMRNRALDGTSDITLAEVPHIRVRISEATLVRSEGCKPSISARSCSKAGAILMYDATRRNTFEELNDWITAFRSYATRAAVILILAITSRELSGIKRRAISTKEGEQFAKDVKALYCEAGIQVPRTVKEALLYIVTRIDQKVKDEILGSGPNQGIIPIIGPRRYSTNSVPNGQQSETVPKVARLESRLSYVEDDLKRTKQLHEVERGSLQEHKRQLTEENSSLWQRVENVTREMRELTTQNSMLQTKCGSLEQQLLKQENDFALENTKLQSNVESKAVEVRRLSKENANLQKMCTALQQDSTVVKQENSHLKEMLQHLQYQLSLKEEAFKTEESLHKESNAALRNMQLELNRALAENRSLQLQQNPPEIADHWKVSRHEILLKGANLGQGAWGYVAEGNFRGKSVAVKCLHEEIMTHQTVERVHREIRTMASVRHPNLVLFIAAVLDGGPPMIVSELLDTNLRAAYENRWLKGTNTKLEILHGVACALNYLHKLCEPIIHRDISAPNIVLKAAGNDRWTPKVSDFGSANLAHLSQTLGEGAVIYSAPETFPQSLCNVVIHTTKIDVYSYGILLGEVFTEQLPDPDTLFYTLQRIEAQWPHIHSLMLRCIKRNPDERPDMDTVITEHLETFWHIE